MKGFFKKSTSLVLALMMVLSMFAGMTFTANAATDVTFDTTTIDFSSETLPTGWTTGGTITDGKLVFSGDAQANIKYTPTVKNFVIEYDYTQTITGERGSTSYLATHYFWKTAKSGVELSPWMDTRDNGNGFKWRLMLRAAKTYSSGTQAPTSAKNTSLVEGRQYRVRVEGIEGVITAIVTDTTTDTVVFNGSIDVLALENTAAIAGYIQIGNVAGTVVEVDNIKFANLDTLKVNGSIEGAALNTTVLAPGTADDATGIVYGGEVDVDVFGKDVPMFMGGDVVIDSADGYDVTKPGIRSGATLKVNGQSIGTYDITYTNALEKHYSEDFSTNIFAGGDSITTANGTKVFNNGCEVVNGKLVLDSNSDFIVIGDTTWDNYAIEFDATLAQVPGITWTSTGTVAYVGVLNQSNTAKKALQLRWNPATKKTDDVTVGTEFTNWQLQQNNANNKTGISGNPVYNTLDGNLSKTPKVGSTLVRNVRVEVENGFVTYYYKDETDADWTIIYTVGGYEGHTGAIVFAVDSQPLKMTVDNIKINPLGDLDDQSAYGTPVVSADAAATYDINTNTLAVTGTISQNFYGFKPSAVTSLADCSAYYNGDDTATVVVNGEYITIPCAMAEAPAKEVEVKLDEATELSTTPLEFTTNYKEMVVEYDITPYLIDYFKNPAISIRLHGDGTQYGGKTVTYYEVGFFYPAYGTSTSTKDVVFEVGSEGVSAKSNYARLYYRGADSKIASVASGFHGIVTNTVVTEENFAAQVNGGTGGTSTAPATKKTEGVVTYRVRIVVQGGNLSYQVAEKGEDAIDWSTIEPVTFGNCGINGTFDFLCGSKYAAATLNNVTVQDLTADALTDNYVAKTEAVVVGTPAEALTFTNVTKLNQKIAMIGVAADKIEGYDATKAGAQNVTITKNGVSFTKRVIVTETEVDAFEDFGEYKVGDTTAKTGKTIVWNTAVGAVQADGTLKVTAANMLSSAFTSIAGGLSMDVYFPREDNSSNNRSIWLGKFDGEDGIVGAGLIFNGDDVYGAVAFKREQNKGPYAELVTSKKLTGITYDTLYRMEVRVYGNTIKGMIDGKEFISYSFAADHYVMAQHKNTYDEENVLVESVLGNGSRGEIMVKAQRWGILNDFLGTASAQVTGVSGNSGAIVYMDNIVKNHSLITYTVDGSAINALNALPTRAQAGDKVVVSADVNANGVLKVNGKNVFQNAADDFGGTGTEFVFTMPAADAVITAEGEGSKVETIASSVRTDKTAVRFLNRIYLPSVEGGLSVEGIKSFGAVVLPADLLGEAQLTLETSSAYDAVAFDGENATLYDITGKYVDYVVAITTSNPDRVFACRAYYVIDDGTAEGQVVYGETTLTRSIN